VAWNSIQTGSHAVAWNSIQTGSDAVAWNEYIHQLPYRTTCVQ
jgi:hypothetical protein